MSSSRSGRSLVEVREWERRRANTGERGRQTKGEHENGRKFNGEMRAEEKGNGSINQFTRMSRMRVTPFDITL